MAQGWYAATESANQPPRIEDFNAIDLLITTQLAYNFQEGIAEYDPTTVYFVGSFCQVAGVVYVSQSNSNAGNNPTTDSGANWLQALEALSRSRLDPPADRGVRRLRGSQCVKARRSDPRSGGWLTALAAAANSGAANGIDAKTLATITPVPRPRAPRFERKSCGRVGERVRLGRNGGGIVGAAPGSGWPGSLAAPTTSFTPPPPSDLCISRGRTMRHRRHCGRPERGPMSRGKRRTSSGVCMGAALAGSLVWWRSRQVDRVRLGAGCRPSQLPAEVRDISPAGQVRCPWKLLDTDGCDGHGNERGHNSHQRLHPRRSTCHL